MTPWRPPGGRSCGGVSLAWLAHPLTLAALVVLVVNDHVLKAALPGPLTGKLSDVAGLVVAPPLLAFACGPAGPRLPARWMAIAAVAATGVGFALVKATATGAAVASAAWSVPRPSVIRADVTDLVALPALALAWWAFVSASRHPAPSRAVRVARAVVLLPAAGLAVAATSAADYATASGVVVHDGVVMVVTDDPRTPSQSGQGQPDGVGSSDGVTWRDLSTEERAYLATLPWPVGRQLTACVPADPRECYRVDDAALSVAQSRDAEGTWTVVWSVSPGRRQFLARGIDYVDDESYAITTHAVGVLPVPGGHVVVVAEGRDGILVRGVSGRWERIGFPTPASRHAARYPDRPPALTERGARLGDEYLLASLAAGLAVLLGVARWPLSRPRPGRTDLPWLGAAIVPVYLVAALMLAGMTAWFGFPAGIRVGMIAAWVLTLCVALVVTGGVSVWRVGVVVALATASVVAMMRPMIGWSVGDPDLHATAAARAAAIGGVGLALTVLCGLSCGLGAALLSRGRPTPGTPGVGGNAVRGSS